MVPAVGGVGVARGAHAQAGRSAELSHGHHQRLFQQPALVHVFQQRREGPVQLGAVEVAQRLEVGGMGIPGIHLGIAVGDGRPVQLDEPGSGFHQPAGQQGPLAEGGSAVAVPHLAGFLVQIEGIPSLAG